MIEIIVDSDKFLLEEKFNKLWIYRNSNDRRECIGKYEIENNKPDSDLPNKSYVIEELKNYRSKYLKAIEIYDKLMLLK